MSLSSSLLWRGLLALAVGVVSIAWPNVTVGAFVIVFAVSAFIAAAVDAMRAFGSSRAGHVLGYLLLSALSVVAGVVALVWPGITALVLVLWIAAWATITGIVEVVLAFRRDATAGDRALWAITGLVSVALGIVFFVRPDIGALAAATVFGLFSIVYGTSALILSSRARRADLVSDRFANSAA